MPKKTKTRLVRILEEDWFKILKIKQKKEMEEGKIYRFWEIVHEIVKKGVDE